MINFRKSVMMITIMIFSIISTSPNYAFASLEGLVNDVFPTGTLKNVTNPSIVQEQSAGHFMGGSIVVKTPPRKKLYPINIQVPSCKLSGLPCNAQMELIGGSLSIIKGKELLKHIKSSLGQAPTYAAMMLIKTMTPQIAELLEFLDAKADALNKMNLDGCEAMQKLMDPIFSKADAKIRALRQSKDVLSGVKPDMAQIQKNSSADKGDPTDGVDALKSQLGENYNLVWKALGENKKCSADMKELLMSISGTIVGTKEPGKDGEVKVKHYKSLINKELLKEFIGSGSINANGDAGSSNNSHKLTLYKCKERTKCLKPVVGPSALKNDKFIFSKVRKLLHSITLKINADDGQFTADEEWLLAFASEQLILRIEMDLIKYSDLRNVSTNQTEFIESLSYDVITKYLQELLIQVQEAVGELSHAQMGDQNIFDAFELETRDILRILSDARVEARIRYDTMGNSNVRLRQELKQLNQGFESFFSRQSTSDIAH